MYALVEPVILSGDTHTHTHPDGRTGGLTEVPTAKPKFDQSSKRIFDLTVVEHRLEHSFADFSIFATANKD